MRTIARQLSGGEAGMTLIEVMVAMTILVVGALSTLTIIEGSIRNTSRTTAQEQGTNLARELVERARQVPYVSMTQAGAPAALAAAIPEATTATGTSFTVTRRGVVYTVNVDACSIDDPSDGAGAGDATFCLAPTGAGTATAGTKNVLGYNVAWSGDPITALCLVTTSNGIVGGLVSSLTGNLLGLAQGGAQISGCGATSPSRTIALDDAPDDLRRVKITLSWNRGGAASLTQTTLLASPQ
jgi:prepilin-type N-terminal cleavage/methylation domain-containing protein